MTLRSLISARVHGGIVFLVHRQETRHLIEHMHGPSTDPNGTELRVTSMLICLPPRKCHLPAEDAIGQRGLAAAIGTEQLFQLATLE
jgi:hypothetical protein